MSRKFLVILFSLIILLPVPQSSAQTNTTTTTAVITPTPSSTSRRDALKDRLMERKAETTTLIAEKKEELTEAQIARKAEIERLKLAKKATMDAAREEFKAQLATLKDAQKSAIAEKISTNLADTNTKAVDRMFEILDTLEDILTRTEGKVAEAKAAGKDTTTQESEVDNAKTALEAAKDAVTAQAAKEYIITIGTDTTLRNDVGSVVSQQKQDLKTAYETVRSAKQAVRQAAKSLKSLMGMTLPSVPTSATRSGVVTPTTNPIQ